MNSCLYNWFLRTLYTIALASLGLWLILIVAGQPHEDEPQPIAAPISYEDTMLILSHSTGVAAMVFTPSQDGSVKYHYRFLKRSATVEVKGEGVLVEKYRYIPTPDPKRFVRIDEGSQLWISVGPIRMEWSRSERLRGWIYYQPEKLSVQIADRKLFSELSLHRFLRGSGRLQQQSD